VPKHRADDIDVLLQDLSYCDRKGGYRVTIRIENGIYKVISHAAVDTSRTPLKIGEKDELYEW
jgi:hypothetical protein